MAGTVDAVLRIFTGIETRENVLWLNPLLPEDLKELRLRLHYRSNELTLRIRRDQIDIESTDFPVLPIRVGYCDKTFELKPGSSHSIRLQPR